MASTGLSKTFSTNGTNNKKGTFSFWMKRTGLTAVNLGMSVAGAGGGTAGLYIDGSNKLYMYLAYNGSNWQGEFITNRLFRDTNAYYHIVLTWDTTQATSSDRLKLYVNGVQETSFQSISYPPQDNATTFGTATAHTINYWNNADYFDGIMSHFHYTDGYSYDASAFGSFDNDTGEWSINTSPSVSYGTNGFFILKDGNSVTDQSGNGNNWTVASGTLTNSEDSPSNVFATLNKLSSKGIFSYGNTEVEHSTSSTTYETSTTTLGMTSGKYYCEAKITYDSNYPGFGIASTNSIEATKLESDWLGKTSNSYGYFLDGVIYNNGNTISSGQSTFATNDIIGMALDLDSTQNTLKFYKNGSLINTTNITTNSNGWFFGTTHNNTKTSARSKFNFGNGYFRSDAVSSAGTNASGNGIFEYDVPTGYTALSTKGLNL